MSLFAYHSGMSALLVPMQDGRHAAVSTKTLREHGWLSDDAEFRSSLPRADAPAIHAPTAAERALLRTKH